MKPLPPKFLLVDVATNEVLRELAPLTAKVPTTTQVIDLSRLNACALVVDVGRPMDAVQWFVDGQPVRRNITQPYALDSLDNTLAPLSLRGTHHVSVWLVAKEKRVQASIWLNVEGEWAAPLAGRVYEIDFSSAAEDASPAWLDKYWVFAWQVKNCKDTSDPSIGERFQRSDQGLRVVCLADDKDYQGLNQLPRSQLRLEEHKLQAGESYSVGLTMLPPSKDTDATFFEIVNRGAPLFQLEARNGQFGLRHRVTDKRNQLTYTNLGPSNHDEPIEWVLELCLHHSSGFMRLQKNKTTLWKAGRPTLERGQSQPSCIQFGVAKNKEDGAEEAVVFQRLVIERLPART